MQQNADVQSNNEISGYSLFNTLKDKELQRNNRTQAIVNIIEDNIVEGDGMISEQGAYLVMLYWRCLEEEDRNSIMPRVKKVLIERKLLAESRVL